MPTTPNGTDYTVYSATLPTHGDCYWGVADDVVADSNIPTVLYCHGAGGSADNFSTQLSWDAFRYNLVDNGWAWIEGYGGGTLSWGNADARAAYPAYLDHVSTGILDVGDVVVLGRSMGGLVSSWLFTQSDLKDDFAGWINHAGVSTVLVGATDRDTTDPGDGDPWIELNTAVYFSGLYGDVGFTTAWGGTHVSQMEALTEGYRPEDWDASVWAGKHILCCYGDADTSVPWYPRGASTLRTIWAGQPATDLVSVQPGGGHSPGYAIHVTAMTDFLTTLTGGVVEPTDPGNHLTVVGTPYIYFGGGRYPVSPKPLQVPPV